LRFSFHFLRFSVVLSFNAVTFDSFLISSLFFLIVYSLECFGGISFPCFKFCLYSFFSSPIFHLRTSMLERQLFYKILFWCLFLFYFLNLYVLIHRYI
jgi:hypothetical protein